MATCSQCNRHDLPIKPWCRVIGVAHVNPNGEPCADFGVTDVDVERAARAMDDEEMWDLPEHFFHIYAGRKAVPIEGVPPIQWDLGETPSR